MDCVEEIWRDLNQFMSSPTTAQSQETFRILHYLKQAPGLGLFFSTKSSIQLKAFNDSDWAGCLDTRRSITGFSVYIGDSVISWRSKKQPTVSRSSSKVEYRALATTTCELQWLTYLLTDLHIPFKQPALLYCDNLYPPDCCQSAREKVRSRFVKLLPVSSSHQLADIFTKSLSPSLFSNLRTKLGMFNLYSHLKWAS
ncbi:hypothetical protein V8G54_019369 [Vigna mungo]|uniref:Uncharacterized protein n=1 Tax=Vigna mungo TaxID=3915 RepID=A0AAQ3NCR5_VIGMU